LVLVGLLAIVAAGCQRSTTAAVTDDASGACPPDKIWFDCPTCDLPRSIGFVPIVHQDGTGEIAQRQALFSYSFVADSIDLGMLISRDRSVWGYKEVAGVRNYTRFGHVDAAALSKMRRIADGVDPNSALLTRPHLRDSGSALISLHRNASQKGEEDRLVIAQDGDSMGRRSSSSGDTCEFARWMLALWEKTTSRPFHSEVDAAERKTQ